jgi:hypothetical protein
MHAHQSKKSPKSRLFNMIFLFCTNLCICGLAEVVNPQKRLGPQIANPKITKIGKSQKRLGSQVANAQSPTFAEVCKSNKLFKYANLPICVLAELIGGPPTL